MTSTKELTQRSVGIIAFDAMEVLDYAGPYEVFNLAAELSGGQFEVKSLALTEGTVTARGGFAVVPDVIYDRGPIPDVVIVTGGDGTRALLSDAELLDWLGAAAESAEVVASVCTGSLLLAAAGLLANRSATTHHRAFDVLAELSPTTRIVTDQRFVQATPKIWTSGGISAGIDMSLALVEDLGDRQLADDIRTVMEWGWHSENG